MRTVTRLNRSILLVTVLIVIFALLPVAIYWVSVGHAQTVTVRDALAMLRLTGSDAVLVDVRAAGAFRASHIDGAENWPLDEILALRSADEIPAALEGNRMLLISDSGMASAWAADRLNQLSAVNAFNVEGGMQAWTADAAIANPARFASLRIATGEIVPLAFRVSTRFEQIVAFVGGYLIKPLYMLLTLGLFLLLWRRRASDLAVLGWSMAFFFIGETLCWFNFPIFRSESPFLEYGHSFGMVVCLAFLIFALIQGMDERVLRFSDPKAKCALVELCVGCAKYKAAPCGLTRLLRAMIWAMIAISLMLLNINPQAISYNTSIFGFPVNYTHPVANQLYEIRFSPLAAIILLLAAFAGLSSDASRHAPLPRILLSGGLGFVAFALMRSALFEFYHDNLVWFAFWEEATELVLVASVAFVLWVFRGGLGIAPPFGRWQLIFRSWLS